MWFNFGRCGMCCVIVMNIIRIGRMSDVVGWVLMGLDCLICSVVF